MTMPELPIDGGCRCGQVRFRITALPVMAMACHCTGCQRMTASAFSTTVMTPVDAFAIISGSTVVGGMHAEPEHHHCDWCKGWVFTRLNERVPFVNVRATMLDDPAPFPPFIESYVSEKLPWAQTGASHSFARFPEPHEYPALMAAYRART